MDYSFNTFTCAQFAFKNGDSSKLLMFTSTSIIQFDYRAPSGKPEVTIVRKIDNILTDPPTFGIFSVD